MLINDQRVPVQVGYWQFTLVWKLIVSSVGALWSSSDWDSPESAFVRAVPRKQLLKPLCGVEHLFIKKFLPLEAFALKQNI